MKMDVAEFTDLAVQIATEDVGCNRMWTSQEEDLLRSYHGHLTDEQIGELLGRTRVAVEIHWKRELHLPAPTTDPDYITTRRIALLLGLDNHITPSWVDRGILPGEYIPRHDDQLHRRVLRTVFFKWLFEPEHWIWFDIHRVPDPELRELLEQAERDWGDEWWTTNQVAEYHHVNNKDVLRYINAGRIQAIQAHNRSGRNQDHWANWYILRSEATRPEIVFYRLPSVLFTGMHVIVREIVERKPVQKLIYGLFRPNKTSYYVIAKYTDKDEAVFIAHYIEENGGPKPSILHAAAKAWRENADHTDHA